MVNADRPARRSARSSAPRLRVVRPDEPPSAWPPRADPNRPKPLPRWRRGFTVRFPGSVDPIEYRLSRDRPDCPAVFDPDFGLWLSLRVGEPAA